MSNDPPELDALIPSLTRSTITDDERAALYAATMAGYQLPIGCRQWKRDALSRRLECPGCGMQVTPHEPGPLACISCAHVYLVPDA